MDIWEPHRKHRFLYCCIYSVLHSNRSYPIVAFVFVVARMCLPSRCPATGFDTSTANTISHILFGVEAVMTVTMNNVVFCFVMSCTSETEPSFGGTYHLHHQGGRVSLQFLLIYCLAYYLISKMGAIFPPKFRNLFELHGVTIQKIVLFLISSFVYHVSLFK
jgi:hypothetical protein